MQKTTPKPIHPTRLNLKELSDKGETFHYSNETGELNNILRDILSELKYEAEVTVSPAGNAYSIHGKINTSIKTICARCGRDMNLPINDVFSEIIIINQEKPRAGHNGHTGINLEEGPFCNYVTSSEFNLADFIHEHIVAAEPYTPFCNKSDCEAYFNQIKALAEAPLTESQTNPFSILKKMT
jgi:uncharacterized metal-binding protein YceD (DUF177 family)